MFAGLLLAGLYIVPERPEEVHVKVIAYFTITIDGAPVCPRYILDLLYSNLQGIAINIKPSHSSGRCFVGR